MGLKEILKKAGIEEGKIDLISDELDGEFYSRFKKRLDKFHAKEEEFAEKESKLESEINNLKNNDTSAKVTEWESKYSELEEANKKLLSDVHETNVKGFAKTFDFLNLKNDEGEYVNAKIRSSYDDLPETSEAYKSVKKILQKAGY